MPSTRQDFWNAKFIANMARDAANIAALEEAGWKVVVIWECETRKPETLRAAIETRIASAAATRSTRS